MERLKSQCDNVERPCGWEILEQDDGRRTSVADNKAKRGAADRRQVAAGEGYEVRYFARKHGISRDEAGELIKKVGNDREKLNAAAEKLKKAG